MKEGEPLNDYFRRLLELVSQLKTYREKLNDTIIVQRIHISLTRIDDNIVKVIEETKDPNTIGIQEVIASLKAYDQKFDNHAENSTENAFQGLNIGNKSNYSSGQLSGSQILKGKKGWKGKGKKWDGKLNMVQKKSVGNGGSETSKIA